MLGTYLHSSTFTNKIGTPIDFVSKVRIILLDIEGTTTNVDFVYLTLFPYANRMLEIFFRQHYCEPEIKSLIQDLYRQHQLDEDQGLQPSVWTNETEESELNSVVRYCRWLMSNDRKFSALKTLQGMIWKEGYPTENCMDRSIRMFLQHSTGGGGKIEKSASIPQAAFLRNAFSLAPFLRVILLHTLVHSLTQG